VEGSGGKREEGRRGRGTREEHGRIEGRRVK